MKLNFIEVETTIKTKLCPILEQLNQRRSRADEELEGLSTQFPQMRKSQLIDLQEHFEHYCNALPVFGFNSANTILLWLCRICYQFL